jgi:hypothetical protein
MDYAEQLAKRIIESVIPGALMNYRTDQSSGSHDFDLEHPDGTCAAVEVTISTDQSREAIVAAITNARKGGAFIQANLCRKDWWVHPTPNANINRIRAHVDKCLAAIEADGLDRFISPIDSDSFLSVERIYTELMIESGSVMKWKNPGQIGISFPSGGGFVVPENLQKAIELEALKCDNRRKLGSVGTSERHLFVYVSSLNFLAWTALVDGDMPTEVPQLPDEITDVWAVTGAGQKDKYTVWRASKGAQWQHVGVLLINR